MALNRSRYAKGYERVTDKEKKNLGRQRQNKLSLAEKMRQKILEKGNDNS